MAAGASSSSAPGGVRFSTLIVGGTEVAPGTLPFVVAVLARGSSRSYLCSGTVIAPNAVLTAAHCLYDPNTGEPIPPSGFVVVAKTTHLATLDPGAERLSVVSAQAYQPLANASLGDVAVLILATPTTAASVQLATPADAALYAESASVVVTGWGQTAVDGPASNVLEQGAQGLKANSACAAMRRFVPAAQLCASAPGFRAAICHGDSGGPLLASGAQGWVEIGVASYSVGVCGSDPDYYARVAPFQPWIASQVAGTPAVPALPPPLADPQLVAMRPVKAGAFVSFTFAVPDPATLLETYTIVLRNSAGRVVEQTSLQATTHTWSFAELAPGTYEATVTADYSTGKSAGTVSAAVTIAPPANVKRPAVDGRAVPGSRLGCHRGIWSWPGFSTFGVVWLRNGLPATPSAPTPARYLVRRSDLGKTIACRVTLTTSRGSKASARSMPLRVRPG